MAVSSRKRFSIAFDQGLSCIGKKCDPEETAIFNFTQNGTNQSVVSNASNASDGKRKIIYPVKISAFAGMTTFYKNHSLWTDTK